MSPATGRIVLFLAALALIGCNRNEEAGCPRAESKAGKAQAAGRAAPVDENWCRVCIRSPSGYFSCQRASGPEQRDVLFEKAKMLACKDAQWPDNVCPDQAIFISRCKGDPEPSKDGPAAKMPIPILPISSVIRPDAAQAKIPAPAPTPATAPTDKP